jgi:hypothetical protein
MDSERALAIVQALADGKDPQLGCDLPSMGPYQRPDVIRALHVACRVLERQVWRDKRRKLLPPNTGMLWQPDEDDRLLAAFAAGRTIDQIAQAHRRTVGAIRERLVKLGRLQPAN